MGVPPVDKAMLMCYNLMNPLENKSKNSILDNQELDNYLVRKRKYPLHLDVALPIYSWIQVYQNNRFTTVIYNNTKSIVDIIKPEKTMWYEVTKDSVVNGVYLRVGDKLKAEEMSSQKLYAAIARIKKKANLDDTITVSLFHLDEEQLKQYTNEEISRFYSDFCK